MRRIAPTLAALALLSGLTAGCGGGNEGGGTTETAATTETTAGGDAVAGKAVFESAGCGSCHTLSEAGSNGSVGPVLDGTKLSVEQVQTQVENGGGTMPAFKGQLTEQQILDVATFVSQASAS